MWPHRPCSWHQHRKKSMGSCDMYVLNVENKLYYTEKIVLNNRECMQSFHRDHSKYKYTLLPRPPIYMACSRKNHLNEDRYISWYSCSRHIQPYRAAPRLQSSNPETVSWHNGMPYVEGTNAVYQGNASPIRANPSKQSSMDFLPIVSVYHVTKGIAYVPWCT